MVSAVIVAAGSGKRMKSDRAKQFIELNGKPIAAYTLEVFESCSVIDEIIIVTNDIDYMSEIAEKYNISKAAKIVRGGKERQNSVYNGLLEVNKNCEIVHIHDGVRPFVTPKNIEDITQKARLYGCCVLGVKVKDTIKVCSGDIVEDTPDRSRIWLAHTPQTFKYDIIMQVHKKAAEDNFIGTDDAVLAEKYGYEIRMAEGGYSNIKITTPEDLYFARAIIQQREEL